MQCVAMCSDRKSHAPTQIKGSPTPVRFEVLRKPRLSNEGMGVSREWEIPEAEMGLVCVLAKLYSGWWLNQPT